MGAVRRRLRDDDDDDGTYVFTAGARLLLFPYNNTCIIGVRKRNGARWLGGTLVFYYTHSASAAAGSRSHASVLLSFIIGLCVRFSKYIIIITVVVIIIMYGRVKDFGTYARKRVAHALIIEYESVAFPRKPDGVRT